MEVIEKLQSTAQHCVELVNAAVCLVLHGLHCISQLKDANSEKQKQVMFQKLSTSLKAWVSNYLSVSALKNPKLAKAKEDIKVCFHEAALEINIIRRKFIHIIIFSKLWDTFLQLDCPKELQNEWEHAADGIMKERIDQVCLWQLCQVCVASPLCTITYGLLLEANTCGFKYSTSFSQASLLQVIGMHIL